MDKPVGVIFLSDGESPEFGTFESGEERVFTETVASRLIKRGLCKRKTSKAKEDKK